ncbi:MAG: right-handed parallel beta-helix repeat-containing protein, partial [Synergistales bacterium]|nr:right-handed parallel beta-helix repeat-containing protein [Synergistales bacterium]
MHEFFFNLEGGTALAANWYVVSDGDAAPTAVKYSSTSWTDANTGTANDLNTFLSDDVASGDTVYIKAGEYKLSAQIDLSSKVLHLYGGFAGTETTSSDRSSDIGTTLNAQKQSYRVLSITTDSTIDGFTIKGGNINGNGGGIYIDNSSTPTIINCTITYNTAKGGGGGFYINNGTPTITNCTITDNTANGDGGGFDISNGTPTITNCTITGNTASYAGGGFYITSGSSPTITNCTIVNNTASNGGNEIYFNDGTTNLYNTLIWNADTDNAIYKSDNTTPNYDHCAYPGATGSNDITFDTWANPVSSDEKVKGVTHKVFLAKNNSVLYTLYGKGVSNDKTPTDDQLGKLRAATPTIGAIEIIFSLDITGTDTINTKYGTAKTETFTPVVSLDNVALTTGYTVSWDVEVSSDVSGISINQSGDLTVGSATPVGTHTVTVKAQATYGEIKSSVAEKTVTINVESGDMTLTLTSKDLPSGKVGTAYTEAEYFTATVAPSSADIAWSVEGLPAGLSFDKGKISGTPTASGDFSVKVTVTATLANYNTVSKDITASITIAAADEQSGGSSEGSGGSGEGGSEGSEGSGGSGGSGGSDDGETITVPSNGISGLTPTQKQKVKTLILNSVNDLSQITATDFPNLTSVKISSDVDVGNGGVLDLSSLPATITTFSISGNTSIKSLNLKACKVANIDASNCSELESLDVS